ncbi:MAG: DVUA0089 family protein [Verrucomicrobiota bacterium]|nr:DVUA0089 family protein [Verrucomicrobiota bacterium]
MVFMVFARFLTTASLAACAALLCAQTPASAQLIWKSPHGIFEIDSAKAWTNPAADGERLQVRWTEIQSNSETAYDWSKIDQQLANAQTYHKQLGISMVILSTPPAWLTALPGVKTYQLPPKNGQTTSIVLPWDPVVQPKILNFIAALCQRYDGLVDYVVMGGMGNSTETYMAGPTDLTPALPLTLAQEAALWVASSKAIIDTYAANLHSAPFIMAGGIPFSNSDPSGANIGTNSITEVFNHGLQYGAHFGVMHWGLNVNSSTNFLINGWIHDYSATNPAGFQFTGNSAHTVGGDLGCVGQSDCVSRVLDVGVGMNAQWIEVYPYDADNVALASTLIAHAAAMVTPPGFPPPTPKPTPTPKPSATPTPTPPPTALLNISTRVYMQNGSSVMIGGFIIAGTQNKDIVIRALGPSLSSRGVKSVLPDPALDLYNSNGDVVEKNDNWTTLAPNTVPTALQPTDPNEAVIVANLAPGSYTAVLRSQNGAGGNSLCELYDLSPANSTVVNISTRGQVGTGDDVMIGGFIVGGTAPAKVVIRAIGPSLAAAGVTGALADPLLQLYDGSGSLIFQNDNWRSGQKQQIIATSVPPSDDRESAIVATLGPGSYTAVVSGVGNSAGVGLIEVYSIDPNTSLGGSN